MDIIAPILHRNGDRATTLCRELEATYKAVRAARLSLQECAGHQRNFYPVPGRWEAYQAQHQARIKALTDLEESLLGEYRAIERQKPPRTEDIIRPGTTQRLA